MINALISINPIASNSAGVKAPLGALSASMIYTNTTEAWPKSWISPFEVPSGVGLSDLGCVLHPDWAGADQEESQGEG